MFAAIAAMLLTCATAGSNHACNVCGTTATVAWIEDGSLSVDQACTLLLERVVPMCDEAYPTRPSLPGE